LKGKGFNKWFTYFLVILLCLSLVVPAYGQSRIEEKQDELKDIEEEIGRSEEELEESKSQEETLLREIREIEAQLERARAELEKINRNIQDTEARIEETKEELSIAEDNLAEQDDLVKTRIRSIYENGTVSYVEVLFNSSSFSDFLTRFSYLRTILDQDVEFLTEIQEERDRIELKKVELEEQRSELLNLRRAQIDKEEQIERQSRERSRLLAEVRKEIEARERAIQELEEESQKIENMIKDIQEELRRQEEQRKRAIPEGGRLNWPIEDYGRNYITSPFGYRVHPITRQAGSFHGGIDIGIPRSRWPGSPSYNGNPVHMLAAERGVVIFAGVSGSLSYGYGRMVIIDHGGGLATVYAHAHSIMVSKGQEVSRGQPIAIVGSTGSSTGPHIHFEVRENGQRVNPLNSL